MIWTKDEAQAILDCPLVSPNGKLAQQGKLRRACWMCGLCGRAASTRACGRLRLVMLVPQNSVATVAASGLSKSAFRSAT